MTERSIDAVRIPLSRGMVELPWQSKEKLFTEFGHLDTMRSVCDAFGKVGKSQPVVLTPGQKRELIRVIEFWALQFPRGHEELPDGVWELREALRDDLDDLAGWFGW